MFEKVAEFNMNLEQDLLNVLVKHKVITEESSKRIIELRIIGAVGEPMKIETKIIKPPNEELND